MRPRLAAEEGKPSYKTKPLATVKGGIQKLAVIIPVEDQGGEEEEAASHPANTEEETAEAASTEAPRGHGEGPDHLSTNTKEKEGAEEATDIEATGEDLGEAGAPDTPLTTPKGPGGPKVEPAGATGGSRPEASSLNWKAQGPKGVQPARAVNGQAASKGGN